MMKLQIGENYYDIRDVLEAFDDLWGCIGVEERNLQPFTKIIAKSVHDELHHKDTDAH